MKIRTHYNGLTYLKECPYRTPITQPQMMPLGDNYKNCDQMADLVGCEVITNPMTCAQCVTNGSINQDLIKNYSNNVLKQHLGYIFLGFYTNKEDIKFLFKQCWKTRNAADPNINKFITSNLERVVSKGLLTYEEAEKLIKDEMPELGTKP